jgi:transposase InsO family protein
LLPLVEKLKGDHPAWGIRRVTAYLKKYVDGRVNHKGIALLMRNNGLVVPRNTRLKAKREPKTRKPVTDIPNTFWGEDMTKTWTQQGWAYVHVVLDWGSKKLLALLASATSRASDWIRALDNAVNLQYPDGLDPDEPYQFIPRIVSDNGCQPTSRTFGEHERRLGLEIVMRSLHQQNAFPIVL